MDTPSAVAPLGLLGCRRAPKSPKLVTDRCEKGVSIWVWKGLRGRLAAVGMTSVTCRFMAVAPGRAPGAVAGAAGGGRETLPTVCWCSQAYTQATVPIMKAWKLDVMFCSGEAGHEGSRRSSPQLSQLAEFTVRSGRLDSVQCCT